MTSRLLGVLKTAPRRRNATEPGAARAGEAERERELERDGDPDRARDARAPASTVDEEDAGEGGEASEAPRVGSGTKKRRSRADNIEAAPMTTKGTRQPNGGPCRRARGEGRGHDAVPRSVICLDRRTHWAGRGAGVREDPREQCRGQRRCQWPESRGRTRGRAQRACACRRGGRK